MDKGKGRAVPEAHMDSFASWSPKGFHDTMPSVVTSTAPVSPTKQRRVSTSAVELLGRKDGSNSQWTFRDEMGISSSSAHNTSFSATTLDGSRREAKIRKISATLSESGGSLAQASSIASGSQPKRTKRKNKMWTEHETQALAEGCNELGVGNWTAILNDPRFKFQFQERNPGDLKDRFRVVFPDAYRKLYPNAKTHIAEKTSSMSTFVMDTPEPMFEKAGPLKRRPFSPEEDEALKRGFEVHGASWSKIVKDPIFQTQSPPRKGTDLRDRFRNAFPDLYAKAGYAPRPKARGTKKSLSGSEITTSSTVAIDEPPSAASGQALIHDALGHDLDNTPSPTPILSPPAIMPTGGSSHHSTTSYSIPSTSSLPNQPFSFLSSMTPLPSRISTGCYDPSHFHNLPPTESPLSHSHAPPPSIAHMQWTDFSSVPPHIQQFDGTGKEDHATPSASAMSTASATTPNVTGPQIEPVNPDIQLTNRCVPSIESHSVGTSVSNHLVLEEHSQPRPSTGGYFSSNAQGTWSSTPTSASLSPLSSDFVFPQTFSTPSSVRIGNSAWGPSWLSPNPRLDLSSYKENSFLGWPAIPEHGVFDRYDLYSGSGPSSLSPPDLTSPRETSAHNSNALSWLDPAGAYPGFTHHRYAGDLISGAGVLSSQSTNVGGLGMDDYEYDGTTTSGTASVLDMSLNGGLEDDDDLAAMVGGLDARPLFGGSDAISGVVSPAVPPSSATRAGSSTSSFYSTLRMRGRSGSIPPPSSLPFSSDEHDHRNLARPASTSTGFSPFLESLSPRPLKPFSFAALTQAQSHQQASISPLDLHIFSTGPHVGTSASMGTGGGHHHRSTSQPPTDLRIPTLPVPTPSRLAALSASKLPRNSNRSPSMPLFSYVHDDPYLNSHVEPLSTAALDLHYGSHDPVGATSASDLGSKHRLNEFEMDLSSSTRLLPATGRSPSPPGVANHETQGSSGSRHPLPLSRPPHLRGQSFSHTANSGSSSDKKRKRASWDGMQFIVYS